MGSKVDVCKGSMKEAAPASNAQENLNRPQRFRRFLDHASRWRKVKNWNIYGFRRIGVRRLRFRTGECEF